jgi:hypothetical protein
MRSDNTKHTGKQGIGAGVGEEKKNLLAQGLF